MDKHKTPPDMIRAWLQEQGRKKGWLSRQLLVDGSTLTRWLTGVYIPKDLARAKLAEITGLAIADRGVWTNSRD